MKISPKEYELAVKKMLMTSGHHLTDFRATHLDKMKGADGEYVIDIVARFTVLSADFVVLVECKHQANPIKRDVVQVLSDKIRSTGAHKGMIFSSSGFQKGAIDYALLHGIALVHFKDGRSTYATRSYYSEECTRNDIPKYAGWLIALSDEARISYCSISDKTKCLDEFLHNGS